MSFKYSSASAVSYTFTSKTEEIPFHRTMGIVYFLLFIKNRMAGMS